MPNALLTQTLLDLPRFWMQAPTPVPTQTLLGTGSATPAVQQGSGERTEASDQTPHAAERTLRGRGNVQQLQVLVRAVHQVTCPPRP